MTELESNSVSVGDTILFDRSEHIVEKVVRDEYGNTFFVTRYGKGYYVYGCRRYNLKEAK